jgi:UDP-hydrolysing UDP-N-acetyl-D-glucosamine 2-epimerase
MHLSDEFGYTIKEIEKDGFHIDVKINTLNKSDTGRGMAEYIGESIIQIANALEQLKPDIYLVLGDRSETLAGTIAASCMSIPVAHIHGGEISGSVDESFRHAITKLAHLHFTATKQSKNRVISMGEDPSRIYIVGAPGLDDLSQSLKKKQIIAEKIGLDLHNPILLVIQHPVVTEMEEAEKQITETLEALVKLQYQTVLIYPNADPGGRRMIQIIEKYSMNHPFIKTYKTLPRDDYLALLSVASVLIGNSSSGIIEAPSFHLPVVNIGTRQKGRERANNIIDVDYNKHQIEEAIHHIIKDNKLTKKIKEGINPYSQKNTTEKIVKILEDLPISKEVIQK